METEAVVMDSRAGASHVSARPFDVSHNRNGKIQLL